MTLWDPGLSIPKPQRTNPIRFGADSSTPPSPASEREQVEGLLAENAWHWRPIPRSPITPSNQNQHNKDYLKDYQAVVESVCRKPQPQEFAQQLVALQNTFELYGPEGWHAFKTVAHQMDLPQLKTLMAFCERLKSLGFLHADSFMSQERLLEGLVTLSTQGELNPSQMKRLETTLMEKLPPAPLPSGRTEGLTQDQFLLRFAEEVFCPYQELFLRALTLETLQIKNHSPLPVEERVKKAFAPLRHESSPYYGAPVELVKLAAHLLKAAPNLDAYTQAMANYHGFLADESVSPHCKQLAKVVTQHVQNLDLLPTVLETMRTVESVAGTANLVPEILVQSGEMGKVSPEVWQEWFAGIGTVMASLTSSPERLAQFQAFYLNQLVRTRSILLVKDAPPDKPSEPNLNAMPPSDKQPFPQWVAQWLPLWEKIPAALGAHGRKEFTHSLIEKTQTAEERQGHLDALEALFSDPGNAMPQIDESDTRIIMALYCKTLDLNYAQNVKMFLQLRSALRNVKNLSEQQKSTLGQAIIIQASLWNNEPMPARLEGLWRALSQHHQQFLAQGETDGIYIHTLVKFIPLLLKVSPNQDIGPALKALVALADQMGSSTTTKAAIEFLNEIALHVEQKGHSIYGLTDFAQTTVQHLQSLEDPSQKNVMAKKWKSFFGAVLRDVPTNMWPVATVLFQEHASLLPLDVDVQAGQPQVANPRSEKLEAFSVRLFRTLLKRKDEGAALAPLSETLPFLLTQWDREQLQEVLFLQEALIEKAPDFQTLQKSTQTLKNLMGEFSTWERVWEMGEGDVWHRVDNQDLLTAWERVWELPFWSGISPKRLEQLKQASRDLLRAQSEEVSPLKLLKFLHGFVTHGFAQSSSPDSLFEKMVNIALSPETPPPYRGHRNRFEEIDSVLMLMDQTYGEHAAFYEAALDVLLTIPGPYRERYNVLHYGKSILAALQQAEPDWELAGPETISAMADKLRENLIALGHMTSPPNTFLNYVLTHRDTLDLEAYKALYYYTEYGMEPVAQALLPELLALLEPTFQRLKTAEASQAYQESVLHQASAGLTRLYRYIYADNTGITIPRLERPVLENWARIGTLGLSFTKWQMDAMALWKGQGPKQEPALLEQSGMFQPIPPRSSDDKFFRGFIHHNPDTGISIELRRAYITIAKPGVGTLVIRNSSPVFGRDLLNEPAYFHPSRAATGPQPSFDPETDLTSIENILASRGRDTFFSVMGKTLNGSKKAGEHHKAIRTLLDAFDAEMEPYISWKCGFKNGEAPPGLAKMLESSLASAQEGGSLSPFGKLKNLRLAWVDRYGLPFSTQTFDLAEPAHQQEVAFFLNVLKRRQRAPNTEAFTQNMPNLLAFLKDGLKHNLELVLTPATPPLTEASS